MSEAVLAPFRARRNAIAWTDLFRAALPGLLLVLLAIATILPIGALLMRAFLGRDGAFVGLDNFIRYATEPGLAIAARNSVVFSGIATVLTLLIAYPFAFALTRTRMPGRGLFRLIALLPLLAPSLLPAFGLIYLFGGQGWLKSWLMGGKPVVGVLLLLPAVVAYGVDWAARRTQRAVISGKSVPISPERMPWRDGVLFAFALLVAMVVLGIIGMAIYGSLVRFWPYNLSLGLHNYSRLLDDDDEYRAILNSLVMAGGTAFLGTTLVMFSGWIVARKVGPATLLQGLQGLAMVPVAVPGLVLGLGYVFFFNNPANPLHTLQGSMLLLVLCTAAHFYTVPHLMAVGELLRLDREIDMAAQALRAKPLSAARRIFLPVLAPTLVDIAGYFFVNAMTTVSALIFLFTAQTRVAAIAVVNLIEGSRIGQAAAFAVVIMLMSIIATVIQLMIRALVIRGQGWRRREA